MPFRLPEIKYPFSIDTIGNTLAVGAEITFDCYTCRLHRRLNLVRLARKVGMDYSCMEPDLLKVVFCPTCRAKGWYDRNIGFTHHPLSAEHCEWPQERDLARRKAAGRD